MTVFNDKLQEYNQFHIYDNVLSAKNFPMWIFVPLQNQQNFKILLLVWIMSQTYDSCPSNSVPPITTSISIWLQLSNKVTQNCLKISVNQFFWQLYKLPLEIFQNKFKFWYLVNMHHSLKHYEAWKDEEPIWSKTEIPLPKKM